MKHMWALQLYRILIERQIANDTGFRFNQPSFQFLPHQNQQLTRTNLNHKLLHNVIPLKKGISNANKDKVRTDQKEHKLIEENGSSCSIEHQLEN